MDEEAGSAPGAYRNSMMSKIRGYRRDFDQLRKDLVSLRTDCVRNLCVLILGDLHKLISHSFASSLS